MPYRIEYVGSAVKALRKLDRKIAQRLLSAIASLADTPRPHGSVTIKGGQGELRIRVGDYRVIYEVQEKLVLVLVLRIGHRSDVYK